MSSWQPIDSAPKDGTVVLCFFNRECIATARWVMWGGGVWQNTLTGHNMTTLEPKRWMSLDALFGVPA